MKKFSLSLLFLLSTVFAGAQNLGTTAAYWLPSSSAPTQTCSATSYNGVFAVSTALAIYQCSNKNVGSTYAWDVLVPSTGGSGAPLTMQLENDASPGTALHKMACFDSLTYLQAEVETCPAQAAYGTDTPYPFAGVCIAGCGTSGFATIQYAGPVTWTCDTTVTPGAFIQPSTSVAGECSKSCFSGACTAVDENPNVSLGLGRDEVANTGSGTDAIVDLAPLGAYSNVAFNDGTNWIYGAVIPINVGSASNFYSLSYWQQVPSTEDIPYALAGNGVYFKEATAGKYVEFGEKGQGVGGTDISLDLLLHNAGLGDNTPQLRINGSSYTVPLVATVSGTLPPSGDFSIATTPGMFQFTLSGDAQFATLGADNVGHILYFDIVTGAHTWTWPTNFINAPATVAVGSSPVLASFWFDGTNYNCLSGCASTGSGITQLTGAGTAGPGSGSQALTLASVNSGSGSCGDSTHVCAITTNAEGLVTSQSAVLISGSGGGALTQIAQVVVSSPVSSITISTIPGTYSALKLVYTGESSSGSSPDTIELQFNGDTGANYGQSVNNGGGASAGINQAYLASTGGNSQGASADTTEIPGYAGTTLTKAFVSLWSGWSGGVPTSGFLTGTWNSTTAITSIKLYLASSSNFVAGTTVTLYGEQ